MDAAFEGQQFPASLVDLRIARGDPAHVRRHVLMAACAGDGFFSARLTPEFFAALHPQHAGIGEVVVLQRAQVRAEKRGAGLEIAGRYWALLRERDTGGERYGGESEPPHPLTTMDWRSEPCWPSSSTQLNSRSPLASATV